MIGLIAFNIACLNLSHSAAHHAYVIRRQHSQVHLEAASDYSHSDDSAGGKTALVEAVGSIWICGGGGGR
jgi:hypothetical protein